MKVIGSIGLLLLLWSAPIRAQESLEEQASDLRKDFARPVAEWDDAFVQNTFQKYMNLYVQGILWDPAFHSEMKAHLPVKQNQIRVQVSLELRTPYVNENEIIIPVAYL